MSGEATCTNGATIRTHLPTQGIGDLRFQICLNETCSELTVDLASVAEAPDTTLLSRMSGPLPAALWAIHHRGFWPEGVGKGDRLEGFYVEIRAGIGLENLQDGDVYELKVYAGGVERPEYGAKRSAVYADWVPFFGRGQHCRDASFPARRNWPPAVPETELR
jgi:hypothetical protein